MSKEKIICLVSGGIDSVVGLDRVKEVAVYFGDERPIIPIYIDYGVPVCMKEMHIVKKHIPEIEIYKDVFNLGKFIEDEKAFIYGRNIYLVTFASQFGKIINLFGHKNSTNTDCTDIFNKEMEKVLAVINHSDDYYVTSPWLSPIPIEKEKIVEYYINKYGELGFEHLLELTSCPDEHDLYCMKCPKCFYYYCAMFKYIVHFDVFKRFTFDNDALILDALQNVHKYAPMRQESIKAIAKHHNIKG